MMTGGISCRRKSSENAPLIKLHIRASLSHINFAHLLLKANCVSARAALV